MRTDDLDQYLARQRAHRDAIVHETRAMIDTLYRRIAEIRLWIQNEHRNDWPVLGAVSAGEPMTEWSRQIADFNRAAGSLSEQKISHGYTLIAALEAHIASLRAFTVGIHKASAGIGPNGEDLLGEVALANGEVDDEAAATAMVSALFACSADFRVEVQQPWTVRLLQPLRNLFSLLPQPTPLPPPREAGSAAEEAA